MHLTLKLLGQAKGHGGRKPADQRGLNRAADGSSAGKAAFVVSA